MSALPKLLTEEDALPEARRVCDEIGGLIDNLYQLVNEFLPETGAEDKDAEVLFAMSALEDAQHVVDGYLEQLEIIEDFSAALRALGVDDYTPSEAAP